MNNAQCIRQTGHSSDVRHPFPLNLFCRSDETTVPSGLCLSDKFDEHHTMAHIQRQKSFTIIGTSTGEFIRNSLEIKFQKKHFPQKTTTANWLMIFLASRVRLFCRRSKIFDCNRYPSLEQFILVLNCHCSNLIDFYFDESQTNQFMCDYLDTLSLKGNYRNIDYFDIHMFDFYSCIFGRYSFMDVSEISISTRTCSTCFSMFTNS